MAFSMTRSSGLNQAVLGVLWGCHTPQASFSTAVLAFLVLLQALEHDGTAGQVYPVGGERQGLGNPAAGIGKYATKGASRSACSAAFLKAAPSSLFRYLRSPVASYGRLCMVLPF